MKGEKVEMATESKLRRFASSRRSVASSTFVSISLNNLEDCSALLCN